MKVPGFTSAVCSFLLVTVAAYGQTNKDLIGTWHDERSTLTLSDISPEGRITGTYSTSAKTLAVVGWVNPDASLPKKFHVVPVLFTVWRNVNGSTTVWSGYLSKGKDGDFAITAIWNSVQADADPDALMDKTKANLTVFKPGPEK